VGGSEFCWRRSVVRKVLGSSVVITQQPLAHPPPCTAACVEPWVAVLPGWGHDRLAHATAL